VVCSGVLCARAVNVAVNITNELLFYAVGGFSTNCARDAGELLEH